MNNFEYSDSYQGGKRIHRCVPKLIGSDTELGNFILGASYSAEGSGYEASRLVLGAVDGVRGHSPVASAATPGYSTGQSRYPDTYNQDFGRRYLTTNGGCIYIDLNHLELCTPEVTGAREFVASWQAMLQHAHAALIQANTQLPDDHRIELVVNNSDGLGQSYGAHLNFLVTHRFWRELFQTQLYPTLFNLAAYLVSSIVFTGQGKVGTEHQGLPGVNYQISQRADFFETLIGEQTTHHRPILNCRDEPLCGRSSATSGNQGLARLHVIFYDANLAPVSSFLKTGAMSIMLCMLESGQFDASLLLDDPLIALRNYSRDPDLNARASMPDGRRLTAVELQLLIVEQAHDFVARGGCDGLVPEAGEIVALWEDTLLKLKDRDFDALASRLDWVMKRQLIERVMDRDPDVGWDCAQARHIDLLYSTLDLRSGVFWSLLKDGAFESVVTAADIERAYRSPPEDTRAWTRTMLLRAAGNRVRAVNWDWVRLDTGTPGYRTVDLANPLANGRDSTYQYFQDSTSLDELLDALGAAHEARPPPATQAHWPISYSSVRPDNRYQPDDTDRE
jgi:proteasome accessory factor A